MVCRPRYCFVSGQFSPGISREVLVVRNDCDVVSNYLLRFCDLDVGSSYGFIESRLIIADEYVSIGHTCARGFYAALQKFGVHVFVYKIVLRLSCFKIFSCCFKIIFGVFTVRGGAKPVYAGTIAFMPFILTVTIDKFGGCFIITIIGLFSLRFIRICVLRCVFIHDEKLNTSHVSPVVLRADVRNQ